VTIDDSPAVAKNMTRETQTWLHALLSAYLIFA